MMKGNSRNKKVFDLSNEQHQKYVEKFDNKDSFLESFAFDFGFTLVYHASNLNTKEQEEILKHGLIVSTDGFLRDKALVRFIRYSDSLDLQDKIKNEVQSYFDGCPFIENKIFFSHLKEELISDSAQYLLFGPESLLPLADILKDKFNIDFRHRMIEHGDHCIISATIPTSTMSERDTGEIYEYLLEGGIECCLECRDSVPAKHILRIDKYSRPVRKSGW